MQTTDFLDAVKAMYGLPSDYQLAKKLGVSQPCVTNYRSKRSYLSDDIALNIAHLLDVNPLLVLACVNAERNTKHGSEQVFNFWNDIANRELDKSAVFAPCYADLIC